jgi:hypothetical protein
LEQYPIRAAEAAHIVPPTAGDIKASAMCILLILSPKSQITESRNFANKKATQGYYVIALKPLWFCCQLESYIKIMACLAVFATFFKNKCHHLSRKIPDFTIISSSKASGRHLFCLPKFYCSQRK